jgi:hypothetical protein
MIHHIRRAGPVSSSAIISSALITTCGVITAACIQTGWIAKPSVVVNSLPPVARAHLTGAVEPIRGRPVSQVDFLSEPVEMDSPTQPPAIFRMVDEPPARAKAPNRAPFQASLGAIALPSPWDSLKNQPTNIQRTDSAKGAKKPSIWKKITP